MPRDNEASVTRSLDQTEVKLDAVLKTLLGDEKLADVTLQASDGAKVPANRAILAVRSSVFKTELYGSFMEARNDIVQVDYPGVVVQALVDYCYTDKFEMFPVDHVSFVESHFSLITAADYYNLGYLKVKVENKILEATKTRPCLILECWQGARSCKLAAFDNVRENAIALIRKKPTLVQREGSKLSSLSPSEMKDLLADPQMEADEFTMFSILKTWAEGANEDVVDGSHKNRQDSAKDLTQHICLENISHSKLSTVVSDSGLVTSEQLVDAYKKHSSSLEKKDGSAFTRKRRAVVTAPLVPIMGGARRRKFVSKSPSEGRSRRRVPLEDPLNFASI